MKGDLTMTCQNKVSYYVPHGWAARETLVKCGNTDPQGERAICDQCASNPAKMAMIKRQEENIAADNAWAHSAGWGDF